MYDYICERLKLSKGLSLFAMLYNFYIVNIGYTCNFVNLAQLQKKGYMTKMVSILQFSICVTVLSGTILVVSP